MSSEEKQAAEISQELMCNIAIGETPCDDKKLKTRARRWYVLASRIEGITFQEIGDKLGVSSPRAYGIYKEAIGEVTIGSTQEALALQLARMDKLLSVVWDNATEGDIISIDRALAIAEKISRLYGLDKTAVELSNPSGDMKLQPTTIKFVGVEAKKDADRDSTTE